MSSIVQALTRYWFIAPILLMISALQLGFGYVVANNSTNLEAAGSEAIPEERIFSATQDQTHLPTLTPTFTPGPSPTIRPGATRQATAALNRSTPNSRNITGDTLLLLKPTPTSTPTPTILPTPTEATGFAVTVPILMYHYISTPPAGADAIRQDLSVAPDQFESHLAYLQQTGYTTISFTQLAFALSQQAALPDKPIIITFDDGYRDHYENAFELLSEYGFTGTFFIFTQPIQTANVDYLTWDMISEMRQAGMEFGSHSHTHPDLSNRSVDFLINEILTSKATIEEHIGQPVRVFSYPAGRYDDLTIRVVKSASFWAAVTTEWGATQSFDKRFQMPRVRVRGNDTARHLAEKLSYF